MSSTLQRILDQRLPWASALMVLAVALGLAVATVRTLGIGPTTYRANLPVHRISWDDAVAQSLAGQAVIVDFRTPRARALRPVPGGAVELPIMLDPKAWDSVAGLMESLVETDLLVLAEDADWATPQVFASVGRLLDSMAKRKVWRVEFPRRGSGAGVGGSYP